MALDKYLKGTPLARGGYRAYSGDVFDLNSPTMGNNWEPPAYTGNGYDFSFPPINIPQYPMEEPMWGYGGGSYGGGSSPSTKKQGSGGMSLLDMALNGVAGYDKGKEYYDKLKNLLFPDKSYPSVFGGGGLAADAPALNAPVENLVAPDPTYMNPSDYGLNGNPTSFGLPGLTESAFPSVFGGTGVGAASSTLAAPITSSVAAPITSSSFMGASPVGDSLFGLAGETATGAAPVTGEAVAGGAGKMGVGGYAGLAATLYTIGSKIAEMNNEAVNPKSIPFYGELDRFGLAPREGENFAPSHWSKFLRENGADPTRTDEWANKIYNQEVTPDYAMQELGIAPAGFDASRVARRQTTQETVRSRAPVANVWAKQGTQDPNTGIINKPDGNPVIVGGRPVGMVGSNPWTNSPIGTAPAAYNSGASVTPTASSYLKPYKAPTGAYTPTKNFPGIAAPPNPAILKSPIGEPSPAMAGGRPIGYNSLWGR